MKKLTKILGVLGIGTLIFKGIEKGNHDYTELLHRDDLVDTQGSMDDYISKEKARKNSPL